MAVLLMLLWTHGVRSQRYPGYTITNNFDNIEIPQGAATLAFVFDVTGSMNDDLVQVIEGATKILNTTLQQREAPLYNYVLVPFHDPGKSSCQMAFVLIYFFLQKFSVG